MFFRKLFSLIKLLGLYTLLINGIQLGIVNKTVPLNLTLLYTNITNWKDIIKYFKYNNTGINDHKLDALTQLGNKLVPLNLTLLNKTITDIKNLITDYRYNNTNINKHKLNNFLKHGNKTLPLNLPLAYKNITNWEDMIKYYKYENADELDKFMEKYIYSTSTEHSKLVTTNKEIALNNVITMKNETKQELDLSLFQTSIIAKCKAQFPFYVSVQKLVEEDYQEYEHVCGGSLINATWVLTSEVCCDILETYRIVVGAYRPFDADMRNIYTSTNIFIANVISMYPFPNIDEKVPSICLMKIQENIIENKIVKYSNLIHSNTKQMVKEGVTICVEKGKKYKYREQALRCLQLPSLKQCKEGKSHICGFISKTAMESDLGSSLLNQKNNQVGIAVAQKEDYIIFAKLDYFVKWIELIIKTATIVPPHVEKDEKEVMPTEIITYEEISASYKKYKSSNLLILYFIISILFYLF